MITGLFWIVLLVSIIFISLSKYLEKKNRIREYTEKAKEIHNKYLEEIKKGNIENLDKILNEIRDIYNVMFKHMIILSIVGILVLIFVAYGLSFGYNIVNENNTTKVILTNPFLYNQYFAINYNKTFLGFYKADGNIIILNESLDPKNLYVDPIVIILPFKIPLLNVNWLNPLFSYIFIYLIIQLSIFIYFRFLRKFIKKSS